MKTTGSALFKSASGRREAKDDATAHAAREIIAKEAADRVAKTARLRAARLAQEASEEPPAPSKSKPRKAAAARRVRKT